MNTIGIIPARMGSSRFPGKPLKKILGIPMIGHCYFRSKISKALSHLYVATCDDEIYEYIKSIGGNVVMTSSSHKRASDRAAEAMLKIEKIENIKADIIVMIQGDEPMIYPKMINQAIKPLTTNPNILVSNLVAEIDNNNEFVDPNEIKVVLDKDDFAIYFSREPIPTVNGGESNITKRKQVCVIPFKRDHLIEFNKLEPTPLEVIESIDMLRLIEHGYKVKMVPTEFKTKAVDTFQDLKDVENLMQNDELFKEYQNR
jgi:3-deoxy-manno-octulosonate cytidylyltransferase (CMP-KDO synthetase)